MSSPGAKRFEEALDAYVKDQSGPSETKPLKKRKLVAESRIERAREDLRECEAQWNLGEGTLENLLTRMDPNTLKVFGTLKDKAMRVFSTESVPAGDVPPGADVVLHTKATDEPDAFSQPLAGSVPAGDVPPGADVVLDTVATDEPDAVGQPLAESVPAGNVPSEVDAVTESEGEEDLEEELTIKEGNTEPSVHENGDKATGQTKTVEVEKEPSVKELLQMFICAQSELNATMEMWFEMWSVKSNPKKPPAATLRTAKATGQLANRKK